jgi:hypothetical protein
MVGFRDVEQVYDVYKKYNERLDYLYKLYAQGVPVVVPSMTSIPTQPVPSTIPDPAFPCQCLQVVVPSTSSVPVNSQKDTGTRAKRSRTRVKL